MLSYVSSGVLQQDTRNKEKNIFDLLELKPLVYMQPFSEVWEDQEALLDKLEVICVMN